jgi:2-dehydro-3-deoxyphosphogalactonate aldolase
MRISGVRTFPVQTPFPHRGGRHWLFVRVDTKEGLSGYGEVYLHSLAFQPSVVAFMVEDLVLNVLKGHDPYETEGLFHKVYNLDYSHCPELTKLAIIGGLEMACWDIVGKDVGRPIHRLLGGAVRPRVRTYTYLYPDPASNLHHREFWLMSEQVAERERLTTRTWASRPSSWIPLAPSPAPTRRSASWCRSSTPSGPWIVPRRRSA